MSKNSIPRRLSRADFKQALRTAIPEARCSTQDGLGTKLNEPYIDVNLPDDAVAAFEALCERLGVRNCGGVGVVPYYGAFRRVDLTLKEAA